MNGLVIAAAGVGLAGLGVAFFGTVGAVPGALVAAYGLLTSTANAANPEGADTDDSDGAYEEAGFVKPSAEEGAAARGPSNRTGTDKLAGRNLAADPEIGVWPAQQAAIDALLMPAGNTRQIVGGNWIYVFQNLIGTADPRILAWMRVVGGSLLKRGSSGPAVVYLQELLLINGYDTRTIAGGRGLIFDGQLGAATETAVKAFQTKKGLTADGVVGAATAAALMGATVPRAPAGNR